MNLRFWIDRRLVAALALLAAGCGGGPAAAPLTRPAILGISIIYRGAIPAAEKIVRVEDAAGRTVAEAELADHREITPTGRGYGPPGPAEFLDRWRANDLPPGNYTLNVGYPRHWPMLRAVALPAGDAAGAASIFVFELTPRPAEPAGGGEAGALQIYLLAARTITILGEATEIAWLLPDAERAAVTVVAETGGRRLALAETAPEEPPLVLWAAVPAGDDWTVTAAHPEYGQASATASVRAGTVTVVELRFRHPDLFPPPLTGPGAGLFPELNR